MNCGLDHPTTYIHCRYKVARENERKAVIKRKQEQTQIRQAGPFVASLNKKIEDLTKQIQTGNIWDARKQAINTINKENNETNKTPQNKEQTVKEPVNVVQNTPPIEKFEKLLKDQEERLRKEFDNKFKQQEENHKKELKEIKEENQKNTDNIIKQMSEMLQNTLLKINEKITQKSEDEDTKLLLGKILKKLDEKETNQPISTKRNHSEIDNQSTDSSLDGSLECKLVMDFENTENQKPQGTSTPNKTSKIQPPPQKKK